MAVVNASDGRVLQYWSVGEPTAPAVVCIHGVTLDRHALDDQVTALHEAGYRVITWDMRGHGNNQPMGERFSVGQAAEDLLAIVADLGAGEVILLAQSFGGLVAQEACRRHPEGVGALILIGSPALEDRPPLHHRIVSRLRPAVLRAWPERHLRRLTPAMMSRNRNVQEYVGEAMQVLTKPALVEVTRAAVEPLVSNVTPGMSSVPVLLIRGANEAGFVARMIDAWAARDSRVEAVSIERGGHLVNMERPAETNAAVLRFLTAHGFPPTTER